MMTRRNLLWFTSLQVGLCLLLLLVWPRPVVDDAYIFFTYARHLAASGMFAFNSGEPSYGFSSPAYVILLATASKISGIPVGVALSDALGILMCALTSLTVWLLWEETGQQPSDREVAMRVILFSGPWFFTAWFTFGMETGLAALSMAGFLLWLVKVRENKAGMPWILIGIVASAILVTTRLESCIFVAAGIVFAFATTGSPRVRAHLILVGALAAGAESLWMLYARHTFGTYLPWTSTARLLYYLPGSFGLHSAAEFYHLGILGRARVAGDAALIITFGGPLRFLLVTVTFAAAAWLLWKVRAPAVLRWMLWIVVIGTACELTAFAWLFPLVKNRHLAPYIVSLWIFVVPAITRNVSHMGQSIRVIAIAACAGLWIAGAAHYKQSGLSLEPLYEVSRSGLITKSDRIVAEPIGILSFETQAHILDLGGLTDKDVWPLLTHDQHSNLGDVLRWAANKNASKLLIATEECKLPAHRFGIYCLADMDNVSSIYTGSSPLGVSKTR